MSPSRVRAAAGALVLLGGLVAAGCGSAASSTTQAPTAVTSTPSSSASSTSSTSASSTPGTSASSTASPAPAPSARSVHRLEHALLANSGPPRPASASCRPATTAERTAAPFGQTTLPVFVCQIDLTGHRNTFDVQVLDNGCYVAERTRPGQAIYGCGAGSAS